MSAAAAAYLLWCSLFTGVCSCFTSCVASSPLNFPRDLVGFDEDRLAAVGIRVSFISSWSFIEASEPICFVGGLDTWTYLAWSSFVKDFGTSSLTGLLCSWLISFSTPDLCCFFFESPFYSSSASSAINCYSSSLAGFHFYYWPCYCYLLDIEKL